MIGDATRDYVEQEKRKEITRLRAENERLRKALQPFADAHAGMGPTGDDFVLYRSHGVRRIVRRHLREAAEVLSANE